MQVAIRRSLLPIVCSVDSRLLLLPTTLTWTVYYCLTPQHNKGKHKARLFASLLDMSINDAEELSNALLEVVKEEDAQLGEKNAFGQRYTLDFTLTWHGKQATIRSGWIIETNSDIPKLTTAFPLIT